MKIKNKSLIYRLCGLPTRTRTSSYPLGGDCFIQLSDEEEIYLDGTIYKHYHMLTKLIIS